MKKMSKISETILQVLSIISTTLFTVNATILMHKLYKFIQIESHYKNVHTDI